MIFSPERGKEKISWPNKDGRRYTAKFKSQVVLEALRSQKPDAVRVPLSLRAQLTHPEPPDVDDDVPSFPARSACTGVLIVSINLTSGRGSPPSPSARITLSWEDPKTGRGAARLIVVPVDIPRSGRRNDWIRF